MTYSIKTITVKQWEIFIWMVDNCEKKQNKACKGCKNVEDCVKLYQKVAEISMSNRMPTAMERENHQPSRGNPLIENNGRGLGRVIRRANRDNRLAEGIGI